MRGTNTENQMSVYDECSPMVQRNRKMHHKLTVLITSMTVSFYLSWTPYAINSLLTMLGVWTPNHLLSVIAILFAKSATLINPILYIVFNNDVSFEAKLF